METVQEFCTRHGHGEFFKAWIEDGSGTAVHCPECFPELFAELTAIDAALKKKREATTAVSGLNANLVRILRVSLKVIAPEFSRPATIAAKKRSMQVDALRDALRQYDEAVAELESL